MIILSPQDKKFSIFYFNQGLVFILLYMQLPRFIWKKNFTSLRLPGLTMEKTTCKRSASPNHITAGLICVLIRFLSLLSLLPSLPKMFLLRGS